MKGKLFSLVMIGLLIFSLGITVSIAQSDFDSTFGTSSKYVPAVPYVASKIDKTLLDTFASQENDDKVKVVVNFRTKIVPSYVSEIIPSEDITDVFSDAVVAYLTKAQVYDLSTKNEIYNVASIGYVKPNLQDAVQIVGAVDAWDKQIDGVNLDGEGQTVFIIDTGVDFSHPDLYSKNIIEYNLNCYDVAFPQDPCWEDPLSQDTIGHGTAVAGVVGASGDIFGIAKGSRIISADVFPDGANGATTVDIRRAINWAVANSEKYSISVISISLGDDIDHEGSCDDVPIWTVVKTGIDMAKEKNIAVVISSGNDGSHTGINAPACLSDAIAVSATKKDDSIWTGSNYNDQVKLFAPGVSINTTKLGGGYVSMVGTSFSAPMVSASLAILNQFLKLSNGEDKTMAPIELEDLLYITGEDVSVDGYSFSRININDAIMYLDNIAPEVLLVSPVNGERFVAFGGLKEVVFACTVSDWQLESIDLIVKDASNGEVVYSDSKDINGEVSEANFEAELPAGDYSWTCSGTDANGNVGEAFDNVFHIYSLKLGIAKNS